MLLLKFTIENWICIFFSFWYPVKAQYTLMENFHYITWYIYIYIRWWWWNENWWTTFFLSCEDVKVSYWNLQKEREIEELENAPYSTHKATGGKSKQKFYGEIFIPKEKKMWTKTLDPSMNKKTNHWNHSTWVEYDQVNCK